MLNRPPIVLSLASLLLLLLLAPPAVAQKLNKSVAANFQTGELLYYERVDGNNNAQKLLKLQYNTGGGEWVTLPIASQKVVPNSDPMIAIDGIEAKINWPSSLKSKFAGAQFEYRVAMDGEVFAITRNGKQLTHFLHGSPLFDQSPASMRSLGQAFVGKKIQVEDQASKEQLIITQPSAGNWQVKYVNPNGKQIPMQVESVNNNTLHFVTYFAGSPAKKYPFDLSFYGGSGYLVSLTNPDGTRQTFTGS